MKSRRDDETWEDLQARCEAVREPYVVMFRKAWNVEELDEARQKARDAGLRNDWVLAEEYRIKFEDLKAREETVRTVMER